MAKGATKAQRKPAKKAGKSPTQSPIDRRALVPRANGRGAILQGGNYGNSGGGRPKSEVREAALQGADLAIPILVAMLNDKTLRATNPGVVAQAADKLLKYGLGTQTEVSVDDVKHRLARTLSVLRDMLSPDALTADAHPRLLNDVLTALKPIWS